MVSMSVGIRTIRPALNIARLMKGDQTELQMREKEKE
jgi:hypothetical protein